MEKKQLLDACLKTTILITIAVFLFSCSLPRILVLQDPLTPEEHIDLGLSYEKLRKFDAALREYELAAATLPEAYLYMGNAYFQQKNFSKAEKAYQKAIAETRNPAAYNNLAWLYHETNANLEEAETLSRKAVELSPGNENYGDTLARILEKRRR